MDAQNFGTCFWSERCVAGGLLKDSCATDGSLRYRMCYVSYLGQDPPMRLLRRHELTGNTQEDYSTFLWGYL